MNNFILLVLACFSLYVLSTGGLSDFGWYWIMVGLALFVLNVFLGIGRDIGNALSREQTNYNLTQVNVEDHRDPTRPTGRKLSESEDLPAIIEIDRQHRKA